MFENKSYKMVTIILSVLLAYSIVIIWINYNVITPNTENLIKNWSSPQSRELRTYNNSDNNHRSSNHYYQDSNYKYIIVDKNGKRINNFAFDQINNGYGSSGYLTVRVNDKWGMIDKTGKYIIKPSYDSIQNFGANLFQIKKNDKYGIIDISGKTIIAPKFEYISGFQNGIATVKYNGKYGVINNKGKFIVRATLEKTPNYLYSPGFNEMYIPVQVGKKWGIIDVAGNYIIKPQYEEIITSGYRGNIKIKKNKKWGIIDSTGNYIIKPEYDDLIVGGYDGNIKVKKNDKWGIINLAGTVVLPVKFDEIGNYNYYSGNIDKIAIKEGSKWGYVDRNGNYLIKPQYDEPINFYGDFGIVKIKTVNNTESSTNCSVGISNNSSILPTNGEIHVASIYNGQYLNPNQNMSNHGVGKVNVNVKVKNKPITLFLTSYEPVIWHLQLDKNVKLKKVYLAGYYKQEVDNVIKNFEVKKLDKYYDFDAGNKDQYLTSVEKIETLTGKKPTTLQYFHESSTITINGKNTISLNSFPTPINSKGRVKFICPTGPAAPGSKTCNLSNNGLTAKYASSFCRTYLTNKYYSNGKYYFEGIVNVAFGNKNTDTWTNIGIISPVTNSTLVDFNIPQGEDYGRSYSSSGALSGNELANNDIVNVAEDLDKGKLYFGINGKWVNGDPTTNEGGMDVKTGRDYYAAVSLGHPSRQSLSTDSWSVNFGGKQFKYKMPNGYKAYDSNK